MATETTDRDTGIAGRIALIRGRMAAACERAGRSPDAVRLILVTKTVPPERIREALATGETLLGESKAQELRQKAADLADTPAQWHFIGHLQSNKLKDVLPSISLLHSLDRASLATRLNEKLLAAGRRLPVLVQVNTSYEPSKSGVAPEDALALIAQVAALPALDLQGLMTIGALGADDATTRACFESLVGLRDQARSLTGLPLPELSMGMSGDFELAISAGATLIRVGSAIFGERS